MDTGVMLFLVGVFLLIWAWVRSNSLVDADDCETTNCARDGMNTGLQVAILSVTSFWLLLSGFVILPPEGRESGLTIIVLLSLFAFGYTLYGLYKWHAYRERYKELLLQEAIAKGVEIGMKKAKER